jgi:uncharacterized protein YidB (DUF937 family)
MGILDALLQGMMGAAAGRGGTGMGQGAGPGMGMGMGAGQGNPLMQLVFQMIQQNGGLPGILAKFQQAGYQKEADSWVSTGQNMPITPDILSQVLGKGELARMAEQFGMSHGEASGGLASMLPQIIDGMTPHGQVPDDHSDLVAQALEILNRKTG